MKLKKTILGMAVVAVAGVNAFNALSGGQSKLSDLQMENLEALADGSESMTPAEFKAKTGCTATTNNVTCTGTDGKKYSYAYK